MGRISVRDKLFLLTTISGTVFFSMQLKNSALDFHAMDNAFPSVVPSFSDQHGFVSVLRWAESLHTPEGVATLVHMVTQGTLTSSLSMETTQSASTLPNMVTARNGARSAALSSSHKGSSSRNNNSSDSASNSTAADESVPFHVQLARIASIETYVHLSKTLLQCGILLFLYRLKALSRRHAVPTICLCFLVLLCWKMAQSCLHDILSLRKPQQSPRAALASTSTSPPSASHSHETTAAFLNMLFLLRFAGSAVVNAVLGRAYQRYFCAPWPESWRRVPRYLGSKDLVLSTLYFASSCVAAMSVSCVALRSLCEAALQFETAALTGSLLHCVYFRLAHEARKQV